MENSRIKKLTDKLLVNEGILITNEKNCFYFSGISSSNITLYITKEKRYLITDFRYLEAAKKTRAAFRLYGIRAYRKLLKALLTKKQCI